MNHEESLIRLEAIVKELEENNVNFEKSIELYEEATNIIKNSYEILKNGKGKIVEINEKLEEIDFE